MCFIAHCFAIRFLLILILTLSQILSYFLRLRETHNALQLSALFFSFFFSFFYQPYPRLRNCKPVFFILKLSQYGGLRQWVQFFPRYLCKNWYKNPYLRFYKIYDQQIWQAGTFTGFDSKETNQEGAGDVITSRSRDKIKTYPHYQSAYGYQTWQDGNLPWWAPGCKVTWPFDHVGL